MAFYPNHEPFTILSLLKNTSKSEITSILELLENKTSDDVHKNVLKINKLFDTLNDFKTPMDHCDLLYWYCNIKLLSSLLQSSESKLMTRLKEITTHYYCSKCKKNVLINYHYGLTDNLESHNCKEPVLPGVRLGDTNNLRALKEYDLHWAVHYRLDIKEKLFFKTILNEENEVVYFYTIYVMDEIIFLCLICGCEICGPNNVIQHVFGQRHVKTLNEDFDVLKTYHQHFANLEPELQILQQNFRLVDNTRTNCTICKKNVLFTGLRNHLNRKCLKKHTVNNDRSNNGVRINYHTLIETTIYKGLLKWCICIDNVQYPLFQNIDNKIYCLVCNAIVKNHISLHIESQAHQQNQSNKKTVDNLKSYHQIWSSQSVHIQIEQHNFRKRAQKITCTVCSNYILYNAKALTDHVESPSHKKNLMRAADSWHFEDQWSRSHSSRSISIEAERNTSLSTSSSSSDIENHLASRTFTAIDKAVTSGSSGSNTPMHAKYSSPLPEATPLNDKISSSRNSSPVIAKHNIADCKTRTMIENVPSLEDSSHFPSLYNSTTETARIVPYDKSVLDELYSDGLLNFTVIIDGTKYPTIIKRGNYKHCLVCNVDIPSFVLLHANSLQHAEAKASKRRCALVKRFHDVWVNLPHTDQCRQAFFRAEDGLTCILCNKCLNYDVDDLKSHIDSWEHVQKIMGTHLNGIPRNIKRVSDLHEEIPISEGSPTKIPNPSTAALQGTPIYSKEILDKFYGEELIHYYVRIGNVKYPFIQNMGVYKRCLICNFELVSGVLLHVNSTPHLLSTNDAEKMQQLRKYHDLWMSVSVRNQHEQKYFNVGKKLMCIPCGIELAYDVGALNLHLSSAGHVNKVVDKSSISSDKLKESNEELHGSSSNVSTIGEKSDISPLAKYDDETVMKSIYLNLTQYTVLVDGRLYLYLQNRHPSIYCLVCREPLLLIDNHINSRQHLSRIRDANVLWTLKNFHDNFLCVYPTKLQQEQIYFHPKKMICLLCGVHCATTVSIATHLGSKRHKRNVKKGGLIPKENCCNESKSASEKARRLEVIKPVSADIKSSSNAEIFSGNSLQYLQNTYQLSQESNCLKYYNFSSMPEIPLVAYEKTVMETIYSNLTQYTVTVDNVLYPYIQNRNGSLFCLLCRKPLDDVNYHVSGIKHGRRLAEQQLLNTVKFFHEQFLPLSLSQQMQQIYFLPKKMTCLLCGIHCHTSANIAAHVCEELHKKQVRKREKMYEAYSLDDSNTTERRSPVAVNCGLEELNQTKKENENLVHDWRDGNYFSQESNSVKYYIYSTMEEDISSLAIYDNTVMESVYLNLTQYTFPVAGISYPYLQNRQEFIFCLVCQEPLTLIDNHIENEEHLKRIRHQHTLQLLKQFHEQFLPLPPALQVEQIFFHPKKTKCLLCDIACNTSEGVIAHVSTKQHGDNVRKHELIRQKNSSDKAENASNGNTPPPATDFSVEDLSNTKQISEDSFQCWQNNYQLSQEPNCVKYYIYSSISEIALAAYEKTVMESIYSNLTQYTVIVDHVLYPYIQKKDDSLFCLICEKSVPNIDLHVNSRKHANKLKDQKLLKTIKHYHDQYLCLSLPQQMEQIYFLPTAMTCVLCRTRCHTSANAMTHIREERHRKQVQKREKSLGKSNTTDRCSPAPINCSLEELSQTKEMNEYSVHDDHHFSQESNSVKYSIIQEIDEAKYDSLKQFNDFVRKTSCLDVDIIRCLPSGQFICLICQTEIKNFFNFAHISNDHHRIKMSSLSSIDGIRIYYDEWKRVDSEFLAFQDAFFPVTRTITFCTACGINVQYTYLNEHLTRFHASSEIDKLISALSETKDISDPDFNFVSRKEYCQKVQERLYREDVQQYDIIMEGISYPIIQNLDENMRCLLCYMSINGNKFAHLSSKEHIANVICHQARNKLKNYHDTWLDGSGEFQMEQMYFEKDRDGYYCKICLVDVKATDLPKHISGNEHVATIKEFCNDQCVSKDTNISWDGHPVENEGNFQRDAYYNTESESDDSNDVPTQYPKHILEELYVDYKKHHVTIDGVQYPIFRKTVVGVKCMICKRNPDVPSVEQHVALERHQNRLAARNGQNKLREFHDAWMKLDPSVQIHQKYFYVRKCIPCDVQVDYDSITAHVQNDSCERKTKSFNMTQSDNVSASSSSVGNNSNSPKQNLLGEASTPRKNEPKKTNKPKSVNNQKNAHNVRKAIPDHNDTNILNEIPLRYSKHVKFLTNETTDLHCKCCCIKLKKEIPFIKEHLDSANHLQTSIVPRRKMKYFCEICNKRYGVELSWDKHLTDLAHLARYDNLGKTRKERITEYECLTCDTVVFGDEISLRRNCAQSSRKKKAKELVLPKSVKTLFESRRYIHQNIEQLLYEADEASQSQDKEREVCLALVRALKEIYPKCKAYAFGSRVTGLGYVDSDLDVFLDIGNMYYGNYLQDAEDQADIVKTVAKMLQKQKSTFSDINKVAGARTPIVQVFHKDTEIDCDISFKHGLSVENTAFIRLCLDLQPVLRPTMLYIKEWYSATNMHGISSYALTILMIFYLQTKGYLLSVKELRRINPEKSRVIDGWDTIKHTASLQKMKEYVSKCDYTVIELIESFFEYYAKFDFAKWVISPLMGYLILKPDFNGVGENLPMEMQKYKDKLHGKNPECFRNLTPICVQDPFDLSHNLTKACSHDTAKKFQGYCDLSKKHLSALK